MTGSIVPQIALSLNLSLFLGEVSQSPMAVRLEDNIQNPRGAGRMDKPVCSKFLM